MITDTFQYDFEEEKEYDYLSCDEFELINHIAKFTSAIWQVHAFGEGNTRTTASIHRALPKQHRLSNQQRHVSTTCPVF